MLWKICQYFIDKLGILQKWRLCRMSMKVHKMGWSLMKRSLRAPTWK